MTTYSRSLFVGPYSSPGSFSTLYTVPPGTTSVIRDIEAVVVSGNSLRARWFFNRGGSRFEVIMWSLAGDGYNRWQGRMVMVAGDTLDLLTDVAALHISISGYELAP